MDRAQLQAAMEAATKFKPTPVPVAEWGGTVHIRPLTVGEVEAQSADTEGQKDKRRIARGVARILCDEQGNRLFDPDNDADVDLVSRQAWNTLRAILKASNDLNVTTPEAIEKLGNGSEPTKSS